MISELHDAPYGKVELRTPQNAGAEPAPPPEPAFNEVKLRHLLEAKHQAGLARRDLSERIREAREIVTRIQAAGARGEADRTAPQRHRAAKAELDRLLAEQAALSARTESVIGTANRCEEWARVQGWSPDGRRTAPQPPMVGDARPEPSPMLDGWK